MKTTAQAPARTQATREGIQGRWNGLPIKHRRELMYRFCDRIERLFDRLGLDSYCCDCGATMTFGQFEDEGEHCIECGGWDVATPY